MEDQLLSLFTKYLEDRCSEAEVRLLLKHFEIPAEEELLIHLIRAELQEDKELDVQVPDLDRRLDGIYATVKQHINSGPAKQVRLNPVWKKLTVAAAVLVIFSVGGYFLANKQLKESHKNAVVENDISPGNNKAILTLADGKKIALNEVSNGKLAQQQGIEIIKTEEGQLLYKVKDLSGKEPVYNTIETPRGGQYQVILPDGTRVWLNAATSLKFPASFAGVVSRKVTLEGEAYFEVAKDKKKPFQVQSRNQTIEVLGTHFNVNSYPDETAVKTTLLEGSVAVSSPGNALLTLQPGQQSVLSAAHGSVVQVQTEDVVAWKNGYFMFNYEPLESIMRKVSRWYNVEVSYTDESIKSIKFFGTLSRFSKVSDVLRMLELTDEVNFDIKGRTIRVRKN